MRPRLRHVAQAFMAILALSVLSGCKPTTEAEEPRRPQQAGQPMSMVDTAANLAKVRVGAATGNQQMAKEGVEAMSRDMQRAMRLPDPARRIEPESARAAAKRVPGVRSVVWLDRSNLFAIVDSNAQRSYDTIDAICLELEPLGDTLAVTVNLQSGAATDGDALEILSRNCQLPPGEQALLHRKRQVDVIDPAIRALHKANNPPPREGSE